MSHKQMSPKTFDIAYLSDNLADLLSDIQNHVEITLTKQGVPWAKVLPLDNPEKQIDALPPRVAGAWEGRVWIADDFDDESEEINAMFYGQELWDFYWIPKFCCGGWQMTQIYQQIYEVLLAIQTIFVLLVQWRSGKSRSKAR